MSDPLEKYLASSALIDWQNPLIVTEAAALANGWVTDEEIALRCFEFVRDGIRHSWDHRLNPVTCQASDVLLNETGFCYAKSILLAALLRANGIPAGLCYQRLSSPGDPPQYYLHGLTAIHLKKYGWYLVDARGEKEGLHAGFAPPAEVLPYPANKPGEATLPEIWPEPLPVVVDALTRYKTIEEVAAHLPDVELMARK